MQTIILLLVDILPQIIQGVSIIFFVTYKKQLKQVLKQIQLLTCYVFMIWYDFMSE